MAKRIGDRFGSCVDLATAAAAAVDRRPGVRSTAASRTRGAKSTATGNGVGLLAGNGAVCSTAEGHGSAAFTHLDEAPAAAAAPHGNGVHGPVYQNGAPVQPRFRCPPTFRHLDR